MHPVGLRQKQSNQPVLGYKFYVISSFSTPLSWNHAYVSGLDNWTPVNFVHFPFHVHLFSFNICVFIHSLEGVV